MRPPPPKGEHQQKIQPVQVAALEQSVDAKIFQVQAARLDWRGLIKTYDMLNLIENMFVTLLNQCITNTL